MDLAPGPISSSARSRGQRRRQREGQRRARQRAAQQAWSATEHEDCRDLERASGAGKESTTHVGDEDPRVDALAAGENETCCLCRDAEIDAQDPEWGSDAGYESAVEQGDEGPAPDASSHIPSAGARAAVETETCCICRDAEIDAQENKARCDAAGLTLEQMREHALRDGSCKGKIFETACHACLLKLLSRCEQDPSSFGDAPCPLCRLPLRVMTGEDRGYRAWIHFQSTSGSFRRDCERLQRSLGMLLSRPPRHEARYQLCSLADRADARMIVFKAYISRNPRADCPFGSQPWWYSDAVACYFEDVRSFRRAQAQYELVWPQRSTRTERVWEAAVNFPP